MVVAGCQNSDAPEITSNGVPQERASSATSIPQFAKGDPSVPDASTVFAAQDVMEKVDAMRDTNTLQQKAAPQEPMSSVEESKAMPMPGQANDHSTTALDKNKGG
jgi:hypothetical protein